MSRILALLGLGLLLTACGNDTTVNLESNMLRDALKERVSGDAPQPQITRAALGGFTNPLLFARIDERDGTAFLAIAGRNGNSVTWRSPGEISLTFRSGILVASRGLGEDLMSASAPRIAPGQHQRTHYYVDGVDQTSTIRFDCKIRASGSESIVVLERGYTAQRYDEFCQSQKRSFQNSYWVSGSVMRQSRQWVSDSVGFITVQRVID